MLLGKTYNENCIETMQRMPDAFVDLTVTSPPYDNLRDYKGYSFPFEEIAKELYRVTKDGGIVVWVVGDATNNFCESLSSFKQAIYFVEECGFNLLDTMIYEKANGPAPYPALKRYAPWFEYMFVFSKGRPKTFNPIKDIPTKSGAGRLNASNTSRQADGSLVSTGSYITQAFRTRHNVWKYDVGNNKDTSDNVAMSHPARFPERLAQDHILSWSNEGDVVYDPFMGSGTTAKMSILNNRSWIGSEMSEEYCEIINQRLSPLLSFFSMAQWAG